MPQDGESCREDEQDQEKVKRKPKRIQIGRTEPACDIQSHDDQSEQDADKEYVHRRLPNRPSSIVVPVSENRMYATESSIHGPSHLPFVLVPVL